MLLADDPLIQGRAFTKAEDAQRFMLGGKAIVTLRSHRTGAHHTYKISRPKETEQLWFVSLLVAPQMFSYMGIIRAELTFRTTSKSCHPSEHPAVLGFQRMFAALIARAIIVPGLDIMHVGRCGRCGKPLTVPASIESGLGPDCLGRL